MESFHIIVLIVASVSLIVALTMVGILLTKGKHSTKFPTSHSNAPDGWTLTDIPTVTGDQMKSLKWLGTKNGPKGDLMKHVYKKGVDVTAEYMEDKCMAKRFADMAGIYWDGITTYNGC